MRDNGSFVRWQANTAAQLGYTIGLFLTLAIASLGYALSSAQKWPRGDWICLTYLLLSTSIVALLSSIGCGLFCTVNRLRDFRLTTKIARCRGKWATSKNLNQRLAKFRRKAGKLGKQTWEVYRWQVISFGVGIVCLIAYSAIEIVVPKLGL
jgi:hypothetical protein